MCQAGQRCRAAIALHDGRKENPREYRIVLLQGRAFYADHLMNSQRETLQNAEKAAQRAIDKGSRLRRRLCGPGTILSA